MSDDHDPTNPNRKLPAVRHRERRRPPEAPPAVAPEIEVQHGAEPAEAADNAPPAPPPPPPPAPLVDDGAAAYRLPPRKYQFKKGQSGNPKGRPKGARSLPALVDLALSQSITARIGGRAVRMTNREAMVLRYVDQAKNGDLKAFAMLLKLDPRAKHLELDSEAADAKAPISTEDQMLLAAFLKRSKVDDGDGEDRQ
jgi:hypothetical protein